MPNIPHMIQPSYKTSDEFKAWWFGIPVSIRRTMSIRSAVAGFNAGREVMQGKVDEAERALQAEYEQQAGVDL